MMASSPIPMCDPTAETAAAARARVSPPASLDGKTVALLDIGKERSAEFLDTIARRLEDRGVIYRRYAKPDNSKVAPEDVLRSIALETDVVVEALSD